MKLLRENFQFNADAEISIEAIRAKSNWMYSIIYAPRALIPEHGRAGLQQRSATSG